MKLILASKSPRRQQLLQMAHFSFEVRLQDVVEDFPDMIPVEKVPLFLAEKKATELLKTLQPDEVLLTADTVVILDNEIIGKPKNLEDAQNMLKRLSGRPHTVVSGVCIQNLTQKNSFSVKTQVYFKELNEDEIRHYLQSSPPLDKAGAYGIQDWIGLVGVEKIEGCFYNVMGLPISQVYQALKKFDV